VLIEAVEHRIRYRLRTGEEVHLQPGVPVELPDQAARQLLAKAVGKVRLVDHNAPDMPGELIPPLQPGWFVVYHSRTPVLYEKQWVYPLCGGCNDRVHGTVQKCAWDGVAWTVILTDEQRLPLQAIVSVGRTNAAGEVLAAWTVREHGYDGEEGQR
jgi:hypothetical protein